jgi:Predicted unusual protein kinase
MLSDAGILDHFSFVEKTPIASASIGQVHVATLKKNHEKVVIKCQHPHAQTLLSDDLISLNIIAKIVGFLEPEYKFFEILMKEWAVEARKELDFRIEVDNLELAAVSIQNMNVSYPMRTTGTHDQVPFSVEIPRPLKHLSSRKVLVMNFCEGKRIDDLGQIEKCKVSKENIMNAVAQVFAYMMYVSDIFNGDPHPGNIFIRPGLISGDKTSSSSNEEQGFTIVLLDWGLAKRLTDTKRIGFSQMTYAASTFDFGLMLDAFTTLGLKLKRENVAEDMERVRFALRDMVPRETARKRIKSRIKTDIERSRLKKKGERVPVESKSYPGEFFFFIRTNELLHGLGSRLGVTMNYLDVIKPFAEKGLNAALIHMPVLNHQDPIHSEAVGDQILKEKVDAVLNRLQTNGSINGAQVCVIQDDKILTHNICGNMGSLKNHLPVRSDTVFLGFSVTKAITAVLAAKMVEDGYMSFDEPICERIWPEFAPYDAPPLELLKALNGEENLETRWRWKRSITLRHILTHTTGLWYAVPADLSVKTLSSCESCVRGFEYNPSKPGDTLLPISRPGAECTYQYLSFGWLVAGCVIGAYHCRHGERKTYQEIYDAILSPLHSSELRGSGFKPCGGDKAHDAAHVETDIDFLRFMQMKREAEAMGEEAAEYSMDINEGSRDHLQDLERRNVVLKGIEGREFILDPRIWNSNFVMPANVPAAGGRFSAKGIALFYHELASGKMVSPDMLTQISSVSVRGGNLQELQGETLVSNRSSEGQKSSFGLGFQIITIENVNDGDIFGHAGVGGSIGFHHIRNNTSVGIMLNRIGAQRESVKDIISTISKHLTW